MDTRNYPSDPLECIQTCFLACDRTFVETTHPQISFRKTCSKIQLNPSISKSKEIDSFLTYHSNNSYRMIKRHRREKAKANG